MGSNVVDDKFALITHQFSKFVGKLRRKSAVHSGFFVIANFLYIVLLPMTDSVRRRVFAIEKMEPRSGGLLTV